MLLSFKKLPIQAQEEFLILIENDYDLSPEDCVFSLVKISYEQLLEEFDLILGFNLIDEIENDYIKELAKDIKDNGLTNIPICSEGVHRSLAHLYLKKDMLRFELIYINTNHLED